MTTPRFAIEAREDAPVDRMYFVPRPTRTVTSVVGIEGELVVTLEYEVRPRMFGTGLLRNRQEVGLARPLSGGVL